MGGGGGVGWRATTAAASATLGGGKKKNGRKEERFHGKWEGGECMVERSLLLRHEKPVCRNHIVPIVPDTKTRTPGEFAITAPTNAFFAQSRGLLVSANAAAADFCCCLLAFFLKAAGWAAVVLAHLPVFPNTPVSIHPCSFFLIQDLDLLN